MAVVLGVEKAVTPPSTHPGGSSNTGTHAVTANTTIATTTEDDCNDAKYKCNITSERFYCLKRMVEAAVKEHRVFTIKGGWQTLRRAFLNRNWMEKFEMAKPPKQLTSSGSMEDMCSNLPNRQTWESHSAHVAKCERTVISRLLQNYDVDFYWNTRKEHHDINNRMNCHKLINRFSRSLFTSKEGLCLLLQQMYWHNEPGVAQVNFPRCYVLGFPDHYNNFLEDFHLTACMSVLKFVVHKFEMHDQYAVQSPEGSVPYQSIRFAMERLNEYLDFRRHADIDKEYRTVDASEWDMFLHHFKQLVHEGQLFLEAKEYALPVIVAACRGILKSLTSIWPQTDLDGMHNIWILKPGNKCRGRGIQLIKDVKEVARIMDLKLKYVVQKYIEEPLIIHQTKFDIRQWFLITSVQPLVIWMYRDSYLRFSSQNFRLDNFHESLHLTNHAVQCKYKNTNNRDKELPDENMWDCHMFKSYLKKTGHENKWDTVIFPGMKESIIGSMLACQETMDRRPNTFELYGADFILAEDFKPWLLEINSSPDLSSSTSVTARMCPECLEDLVKVVIDKRRDQNADTGLFQMVYKQNLPRAPAYLGTSLSVRGRRIFKRNKSKKDKENEYKKSSAVENKSLSILLPPTILAKDAPDTGGSELVKRYSGPVIQDLMDEIKRNAGTPESDNDHGYELVAPLKPHRKKKTKVERNKDRRNKRKLQDASNAVVALHRSKAPRNR